MFDIGDQLFTGPGTRLCRSHGPKKITFAQVRANQGTTIFTSINTQSYPSVFLNWFFDLVGLG